MFGFLRELLYKTNCTNFENDFWEQGFIPHQNKAKDPHITSITVGLSADYLSTRSKFPLASIRKRDLVKSSSSDKMDNLRARSIICTSIR